MVPAGRRSSSSQPWPGATGSGGRLGNGTRPALQLWQIRFKTHLPIGQLEHSEGNTHAPASRRCPPDHPASLGGITPSCQTPWATTTTTDHGGRRGHGEYVTAMYSKFVSTMRESNHNRELYRPDWMHLIRSQAFATCGQRLTRMGEWPKEQMKRHGSDRRPGTDASTRFASGTVGVSSPSPTVRPVSAAAQSCAVLAGVTSRGSARSISVRFDVTGSPWAGKGCVFVASEGGRGRRRLLPWCADEHDAGRTACPTRAC